MRKICYMPDLVGVAGGVTAALMMSQLEYWFKVMEGKSFYKFLEPCGHPCYKKGSSWCEELGMSSDEVRSAFRKIGVMYKSKRSFNESEDRFQGKLYAAYYDRIGRTTHYFRNDKEIQKLFKEIESQLNSRTDRGKAGIEESKIEQKEEITMKADSKVGGHQSKSGGERGLERKQKTDEICLHELGQAGLTEMDRIDAGKKAESSSGTGEREDGLNIKEFNDQNNKENKRVCQDILELYNAQLGEILGTEHPNILKKQETYNRLQQLWNQYGRSLDSFSQCFAKVAASNFLCARPKEGDRSAQGEETERDRAAQGEEAKRDRSVQGEETERDRSAQKEEAERERSAQGREVKGDRSVQGEAAKGDRSVQGEEAKRDRSVQGEGAERDRSAQGEGTRGDRSMRRWRASLGWLLKENHFEKVLDGRYDDYANYEAYTKIEKKSPVSQKVQTFNQMYSRDWDFDEIERLENLYIDQMLSQNVAIGND